MFLTVLIYTFLYIDPGYPTIKNNLRTITRLDARTQKNFKGEK